MQSILALSTIPAKDHHVILGMARSLDVWGEQASEELLRRVGGPSAEAIGSCERLRVTCKDARIERSLNRHVKVDPESYFSRRGSVSIAIPCATSTADFHHSCFSTTA